MMGNNSITMLQISKVYDISVTLGKESIVYPGDLPFSREITSSLERGDESTVSVFHFCAHEGTHLDAPAHFIPGGKTLDEYPIERFILRAHVVDITHKNKILPEELSGLHTSPDEALLFRTENSRSGANRSGKLSMNYVSLSLEAADDCIERKVSLVGVDALSIEEMGNSLFPVHHRLLEYDILILEGIHLEHVPPGRYTLYCPPVKIQAVEGAPARAFLIA